MLGLYGIGSVIGSYGGGWLSDKIGATTTMRITLLANAVGFLAFGWAIVPMSIWFGHPWSTTAKYLLDALIYALVIAGSFAWLWPT